MLVTAQGYRRGCSEEKHLRGRQRLPGDAALKLNLCSVTRNDTHVTKASAVAANSYPIITQRGQN